MLYYETIVNLIAKTTASKGLKVICKLDRRKHPTGRKIIETEMKQIKVERDRFHSEWTDVIKPGQPSEL